MDITLKDKNGVTLHTAKKHCKEDITVRVETQEISITPSATEQVEEGLFNKVTVQGDEDLVAENIKKGKNIFGVEGGFDAVDTRDATATTNDIAEGTTAYVDNQKIEGTVPNNGELQYEPSDEEQTIPAGITTGGTVKATDITKLNEYEACLTLANSIDNLDDYTETTAKAEDIRAGKTAYSNGERLTGTLQATDNNAKIESCTYSLYANSIEYYISEIDFTGIALKSKLCESMFQSCFMLKKIKGLNTSGVTSMYNMFASCYELTDIEVLDTSTLANTGMRSMFNGCTKLSNESLNNILQMCINAVKVTTETYKTLSYIGLTSAQATVCQGLSNYQAFLDAGWTTGY